MYILNCFFFFIYLFIYSSSKKIEVIKLEAGGLLGRFIPGDIDGSAGWTEIGVGEISAGIESAGIESAGIESAGNVEEESGVDSRLEGRG